VRSRTVTVVAVKGVCCELIKRNVSFHGTGSCLKDFWLRCLRFDKFLAMPGFVGKCIV